jgi:adenylate kinase family enzyme
MRRVLVIGPPGSGKSTFARRLSEATGLPCVHLDREYWQPGWVEPDHTAWRDRMAHLVSQEAWIIEGNYDLTLDLRLARADTMFWFRSGRVRSIWRVARRIAANYGQVRPDMAPGCPERLDFGFMLYIWRFPSKQGLRTKETMDRFGRHLAPIVITSDAQSHRILAALQHGSRFDA